MSGDNQMLELIWENQFYRRLCFTMETMRIDWGESILVVGCSVHQNCVHSLICSVLVLFFCTEDWLHGRFVAGDAPCRVAATRHASHARQ